MTWGQQTSTKTKTAVETAPKTLYDREYYRNLLTAKKTQKTTQVHRMALVAHENAARVSCVLCCSSVFRTKNR